MSDVIVVGGGLAGLSAAVALASDGAKVTLLERRPSFGGRAYSYEHPALAETVDSQHVVLGCCTNLLQLMQQAEASHLIRWYDELCFLEPGSTAPARRSIMKPSGLPAPLHRSLSFLQAPMLGLKDKVGIATGLLQFLRGYPDSDSESFADWLKRTDQTERAIRHFWEPVVVGALNDGFDACSVKYAGKVFHESFLKSVEGGRLGIPAAPLTEFFHPVVNLAERLGVEVKLKCGAESIERRTRDAQWVVRAGEEGLAAETVILATDFSQTRKLLEGVEGAGAITSDIERFTAAPITTVHLWYDRDVTELDHAVLLDTRIQWVFAKSRIRQWIASQTAEHGFYLELVVSASWAEIGMGREEILASALRELVLFFPKVRDARLLKSGVLKEARATFSVTPGLDAFRPDQRTEWPGLFLAGDWTATAWPSTMEGAIRSGRLAAGSVAGEPAKFMAPETPASGLMGWLSLRQPQKHF